MLAFITLDPANVASWPGALFVLFNALALLPFAMAGWALVVDLSELEPPTPPVVDPRHFHADASPHLAGSLR